MHKKKCDWTKEEDMLLVNLIFENKKKGKKLKTTWVEAGKILNRTPGACEFRWYDYLSKKHKSLIDHNKLQSELHKENIPLLTANDFKNSQNPFHKICNYVLEINDEYQNSFSENIELREENKKLKEALNEANKTIHLLSKELSETRKKLEYYDYINGLIKEFNAVNA